jgi:S-adenosylmethionine decarboxylase
MVYVGIPQNYTQSPSSFAGTPSLTINYEATQDLDSTNAFEGLSSLPWPWLAHC